MSVEILDASAWREFRGVPPSKGINETTHLARIADSSGGMHNRFVKLLPLNTPALLCEALGWILAKRSNVSCPDFGAIVLVPVQELQKHQKLSARFLGMLFCPAWCSEIVQGRSVAQVHKMAYFLAKKECLRSKDAKKIAAFDQWTDLRDRNFGNVIRSSRGGYVAIDHETLLHDMLWSTIGITYEERSLLEEARSALDSTEIKKFSVDMANAAKGHSQALQDAEKDIENIIGKLFPTNAATAFNTIKAFLEQRAQSDWLSNQLGVIA